MYLNKCLMFVFLGILTLFQRSQVSNSFLSKLYYTGLMTSSLCSLPGDREAVGPEAEHSRGHSVRDRTEAEASDGFGGGQPPAAASRLDR